MLAAGLSLVCLSVPAASEAPSNAQLLDEIEQLKARLQQLEAQVRKNAPSAPATAPVAPIPIQAVSPASDGGSAAGRSAAGDHEPCALLASAAISSAHHAAEHTRCSIGTQQKRSSH